MLNRCVYDTFRRIGDGELALWVLLIVLLKPVNRFHSWVKNHPGPRQSILPLRDRDRLPLQARILAVGADVIAAI